MISCVLQLQLASAQSAELQQLILNVEKLAQLKKILSGMKSTYDIVVKGYERIKGLTEGNYSIHSIFLDGLLQVSPQIRKYKKVGDIISFQLRILDEYRSAVRRIKSSSLFTLDESNNLIAAFREILDLSIRCVEELSVVLTAGKLRMSDEERISAIDRIYDDAKESLFKFRLQKNKALSIEYSRSRVSTDAEILKGLLK